MSSKKEIICCGLEPQESRFVAVDLGAMLKQPKLLRKPPKNMEKKPSKKMKKRSNLLRNPCGSKKIKPFLTFSKNQLKLQYLKYTPIAKLKRSYGRLSRMFMETFEISPVCYR